MMCTVRDAARKWESVGGSVILEIYGTHYFIEDASKVPATFNDWLIEWVYLPDGFDSLIYVIVPPWSVKGGA